MALVDGVATPEDCCRLCSQQYEGSAAANASVPCNAWNHCGRDEGCAWAGSTDNPTPLRLAKGQCQLKFQELSDVNAGSPLFVEVGVCQPLLPHTRAASAAAAAASRSSMRLCTSLPQPP